MNAQTRAARIRETASLVASGQFNDLPEAINQCLRRDDSKPHFMAVIGTEIWLRNATAGYAGGRTGRLNTYSLSQSLGISNATCRRKIQKLTALGWVNIDNRKQLATTKAFEEEFLGSQRDVAIADFLSTAVRLLQDLGMTVSNKPEELHAIPDRPCST